MKDLMCTYCGKRPAEINLQRLWVMYPYKHGKYGRPKVIEDQVVCDDNFHLCKKCYGKWLEGVIEI
jgi:hypothetical protein